MNHTGTVILETPRLILRPFTMADDQAMFDNWASDPEVTKYITWPAHSSVDITRMVLGTWVEEYARPDRYQWAMVLKDGDGKPVGNISVVRMDEAVDACEIGYCMGKAWWGRGLMTEALCAVIDHLFENVGFNRVCARHDPRNPGSGRVMRKVGMTYEGTLRQVDRNNQGICDLAWYSILRPEWKK